MNPLKLNNFAGISDKIVSGGEVSFEELVNLRHITSVGGIRLMNRYGISHIRHTGAEIYGFTENTFDEIKSTIEVSDDAITSSRVIAGGIGSEDDIEVDGSFNLLETMSTITEGDLDLKVGGAKARGNVSFIGNEEERAQAKGKIFRNSKFPRHYIGDGTDFSDIKVGDKLVGMFIDVWGGSIEFKDIGYVNAITTVRIPRRAGSTRTGYTDIYPALDVGTANQSVPESNNTIIFFYIRSISNIPADGDSITINGIAYTFKTNPLSTYQVQIGSDSYDTAINFNEKVNLLDVNVISFISSTRRQNCVTLEAKDIGSDGNSITLAKSGSNITISGSTLTGGINPGPSGEASGVSGSSMSINKALEPNGLYKYMIAKNTSITTSKYKFAVIVSVSDSGNGTLPTLTMNKDIYSGGWRDGHTIVFFKSDLIASDEDVTDFESFLLGKIDFVNVGGKNNLVISGMVDTSRLHQIWIGRIKDRYYFNNDFAFNGIYATEVLPDFETGWLRNDGQYIKTSKLPKENAESGISIGDGYSGVSGESFTFSFSLVLDNFNETTLYRDTGYGTFATTGSYVTTNGLELTDSVNDNLTQVAKLKIVLPSGELINRRVTSLRIYGQRSVFTIGSRSSKTTTIGGPWRLCRDIDINDSSWTYNSTDDTYEIEVRIDNIVNTGEIYTNRLGYSFDESLIKIPYSSINLAQRQFVVDKNQRNIVYFSPINSNGFSTSILPDSNFIMFNRERGDIKALSSINNKLIVWKENAIISYSVEGLPVSGKDSYISQEDGLCSIRSIANSERVIFYAGFNGIRMTDGFKTVLINQEWINTYISYSSEELNNSIGFYDKLTYSYYIQIGPDIWAYDTLSNKWRNENLIYGALGNITYASKTVDGKTVLYCSYEQALYEYPRTDLEHYDTFDIEGTLTDFSILSYLKTNEIYSPDGLDSLIHINGAYIICNGIENSNTGLIVRVLRGGHTIAERSISRSNYTSNLTTRSPLDKFAIYCEVSSEEELILNEIGLYPLSIQRVGNQRIGAKP